MPKAKRKNKTKVETVQSRSGLFWLIGILVVIVGLMVADQLMLKSYVRSQNGLEQPASVLPRSETKPLIIGDQRLQVEVRDDDAGRALGLSGRERLNEGEGMLFVFDKASKPVFWMKDMRFGLDIIWISEGEVVQVEEDVPPPTKQEPIVRTMVPKQAIDMVLEVPAGFVSSNSILVGDQVTFGQE